MSNAQLLNQIAATDATFARRDDDWIGKCLICGGPIAFSVRTGEGATVEHILPRSLGGTNELRNLGIAHRRCNGEKGRHWDPKRRHRRRAAEYDALVRRLRAERTRRWRDAASVEEVVAP